MRGKAAVGSRLNCSHAQEFGFILKAVRRPGRGDYRLPEWAVGECSGMKWWASVEEGTGECFSHTDLWPYVYQHPHFEHTLSRMAEHRTWRGGQAWAVGVEACLPPAT